MQKVEEKTKPSTYARAGVDIRRENIAIKNIINWAEKTFKFREGKTGQPLAGIGTFANMVDIGNNKALVVCTDGVGSKVIVAQELEKYDTVGIDVVAMNVNDALCVGAEPITMVDYLAMEESNAEMAGELAKGLYEGCQQAGIALVGGETACLPDMIKGINGRGFDLAGTAVGIVDRDKIVTGERIQPGDKVIGFESNGIHSNGLTLARKVLPVTMWTKLLEPTRIYVKEVLTLLGEYDIKGMAHITGSGILNPLRITKYGYHMDNMPEPQMIFKKIQELGKVPDEEMYRTFNMGMGFCVIVGEKDAHAIKKKYGQAFRLDIVGTVIQQHHVKIIRGEKTVLMEE
ncbi:MAG: phosphoribosylformylglycinamidine cyclo-ligase [Candidatus Altiarchaeota archaeon]|nr:phosphoribosylformylglycinamidine cyclo-ligase [Candidatus Altiarchaeota archaeon]